MALNPPINSEGQPMRVEGEYFAVLRKNMEIEVKVEGWSKLTAKGKLFVTTARLVFVNDKHAGDTFKSFDIPLLNIFDEKFEQPIFGANYLSIKVKPLFNLIPGDAKVKIWFMSGGCQKFLDIFLQVLPQIRKRKSDGADPGWIKDLTSGNLNSKYAYVDPSDPTYVFVTQPQAVQQNQQMNDYYSKFPDAQPGVDYAPSSDNVSHQQPQSTVPNYQQQQQQPQPSYNAQVYQPFGGQGVVLGSGEPYQNQQNQGYNGGYQPPQIQQPSYNQYDPQQNQGFPQQNQPQYQQAQPQPQYQQNQNQNQNFPQQQNQGGFQQQQQQPQGGQQQQQNRANVGYYYGFWGPQLNQGGYH